ncbi:MAG TPA: glycosyltransferase [Longimicrobiales bacterium]|nr:glycosyltransferase [Longimicrobiales bacterium]
MKAPALRDTGGRGARAEDGGPAKPRLRRPVAVVLSRFPSVTETFILREVLEMERQGQPVRLVPLLREDPPVVHEEARPWVRRALYTPFLSAGILRSNLRTALRHPLRYFGLLLRLTGAAVGSPGFLVRTLAIFPKSVHLARVLDDEGIRHVHAQFGSHPATAALIIATFSRADYSVTLHAHDLFVRRYRPFLGTKLRRAAFVRVISEYNRRTIGSLFPRVPLERVHVVHVGIEPERYAGGAAACDAAGTGSASTPWLLTVAALRDYKGIPVLVDACARLRDEGFAFRAEVVGEGPMRSELERMIAEADLEEQVHLRGARPQHEVAKLVGRRPIFVLPSVVLADGWMEGIPVALMEAMAAGAPVIASRLSGIPELVEDGRTGLLVEPGDAADLARAIRRLAGDPALARRLGEAGRAKVREEFELSACTERLLELVDRANPGPAAGSPAAARAVQLVAAGAAGAAAAEGAPAPGGPGARAEAEPAGALGVEAVHEGPDARVVRILVPGPAAPRRLVVKEHAGRPGQSAPPAERARHEFTVLERLTAGHAGALDVPRPLLLREDEGTLVMGACPGEPLSRLLREARTGGAEARERARAGMEGAGAWLAALQQRTLGEATVAAAMEEWRERVRGDLERSRPLLGPGLHQRAWDGLAIASLPAPAPDDGGPSSPLSPVGRHGDFWPGNVLVDDSRVSVVDFEGFGAGLAGEDPAYFLLQAELFFDYPLLRRRFAPLRDAFLAGYGHPAQGDAAWSVFRLAAALQVLARSADGARAGPAARRRIRRLRRLLREALA